MEAFIRKTRKLLSYVLTLALTVTAIVPMIGTVASAASLTISEAAGWLETAYVEWKPVSGAVGYTAYVKGASESDSAYTQLDTELIRQYSSYWRADAVGLKAGSYKMKVAAVMSDGSTVAAATSNLTVKAHDRSGFAWVNGTASGAYNENGTLKSNAVVLYITEDTKDSVAMDVVTSSSGAKTSAKGLQAILNAYKKGYDSRPLAIRLIGNISDLSTMESGDILIKGSSSSKRLSCGITFEGIGEDATCNGWGLRIANASNVEVRNLGFMNCNSSEGDNLGLQQNNDHVWVHNCDFFYGDAGSDADQAKGDGALDTKTSTYVTHSYNHFFDTGKSNLQGMKSESTENYITYHHNWYDHSDSRHPRIRTCTVHIYNNYFDGTAKYGVGVTMGASAFVEGNYFRNCPYPMLSSEQGSDIANGSEGTFSGETGGIIKAYNNTIVSEKSYVTYQENSTQFDAYEVSSKSTTVPSSVKTYSGSTTYNNFDTNSSLMYSYTAESPSEAVKTVEAYAGRMNGGDFAWEFDDATDDSSYAVNTALKSALTSYKTSLKAVGGYEGVVDVPETDDNTDSGNTDSGNTDNDDSGNTDSGNTDSGNTDSGNTDSGNTGSGSTGTGASYVHNFTESGKDSSFFSITGNTSTSKGTVNYNGLTLKTCLKMESSTNVSFTTSANAEMTLVFNSANSSNVKVDGTKKSLTDGILTMDIAAGSHTITKADTANLFYIAVVEEGAADSGSDSGNTGNDDSDSSDNSGSSDTTVDTTVSNYATLADGWYYIKNVNSQKYLQVANNSGYDGANVEQGTGTGVSGQRWYLTNVGNGYFTLKNGTGYMLDVPNGENADGTNIQVWSANGLAPQNFKAVASSVSGAYGVLTNASVDTKSLDVYEFSTADGGNVCQWTYYDNTCQQWVFEAIKDSSDDDSSDSGNTGSDSGSSDSSNTGSDSTATDSSKSWNFKNSGFKDLGTISSNVTVDGLTLVATSSKTMNVKAESQTVDGTEYTYTLALGGGGSTSYRAVKVPVYGTDTIKVVLRSSGSSARTLVVADESGNKLGTMTAGTSASCESYNYSGKAGYVYLYSSGSGINLYKIQVDSKGAGSSDSGNTGSDSGSSDSGNTGSDSGNTGSGSTVASGDIYVSPSGKSSAAGTESAPMDLATAITKIQAGNTIWMKAGTYSISKTIVIDEDNCGKSGAYKKISNINGGTVVIDFDGMSEASSNRGFVLDGDYWYFYGVEICNAGDNGMLLSGNNNVIEMCQFYNNHDTGLQLSRYNTSADSISEWPAYNTIKNCTSFNNKDEATTENADGFAAKLTCGEGNVFDGCIAYCNSDDGWDLYAKPETGSIGVVTIKNCVAFGNGKLTDGSGSANGDMNGFKLGGSNGQCPTPHVVENSVAFNNGACGFTDNGNGGALTMKNCTAANNGVYASKANYMCYRTSSSAKYTNLLSYADSVKSSDKFLGKMSNTVYANSGFYHISSGSFSGSAVKEGTKLSLSSSDFKSTSIPGYSSGKYATNYHTVFRNSDGSVNLNGLFEVKSSGTLGSYGVGATLN